MNINYYNTVKNSIDIISKDEYEQVIAQYKNHFDKILEIVKKSGESLEGNCFYLHNRFETDDDLLHKQINLFSIARSCGDDILEIGFNAGHSCLLFLIANRNAKIHVFDSCEHKYTRPCVQYLIDNFGDRLTLYAGTSPASLSLFINSDKRKSFDIFHIDGGHELNVANIDFFLTKELAKHKSIVIMNDTNIPHIGNLWKGYVEQNNVREIELLHMEIHRHSIGYFVKDTELKIAVCSLTVGEEYKRITKYGRKSKVLYCERHGYDFFDSDDFFDRSRSPAWSKIKILEHYLDEMDGLFSKYDYVWWIDGDTLIMNDEIKLEERISSLTDGKDITMAKDFKLINSGVMIIRNTKWSRNFMRTIYDQIQFLNHSNWEQAAIIDLLEKNISDSKNHIKILELYQQNRINSYWYSYYFHDCFILHFAGCYRDKVERGLSFVMTKYCPVKMDEDTEETYIERKRWLQYDARTYIESLL